MMFVRTYLMGQAKDEKKGLSIKYIGKLQCPHNFLTVLHVLLL